MKFSQILENTNVYWKHRLAIEPRGNVLINIYILYPTTNKMPRDDFMLMSLSCNAGKY